MPKSTQKNPFLPKVRRQLKAGGEPLVRQCLESFRVSVEHPSGNKIWDEGNVRLLRQFEEAMDILKVSKVGLAGTFTKEEREALNA